MKTNRSILQPMIEIGYILIVVAIAVASMMVLTA